MIEFFGSLFENSETVLLAAFVIYFAAALVRRFDRAIYVELPDRGERELYLKKKISSYSTVSVSDAKIAEIAVRSVGMSLADLESVIELALRNAFKEKKKTVGDETLDEAFESYGSGDRRSKEAEETLRTARHEAGHALLAYRAGFKPSYVTVVSRGDHGGYVMPDLEEKNLYTGRELLDRIRTCLGGRAAEILYYGADGISTSASSDLRSASGIAKRMICVYGMDPVFGPAVIDEEALRGPLGEKVHARIGEIIKEQLELAAEELSAHREKLDALTEELIAHDHLSGAGIERILK